MNPNSYRPNPGLDEQQLIAFHLGESCDEPSIRARLEQDPAFAALSDEIAHTLRVFSADPVAPPDTEAAWLRLRSTLPPLEATKRLARVPHVRTFGRGWFSLAPLGALCIAVLAGLLAWHRHEINAPEIDRAGIIHLRPPLDPTSRAAEADHLDRAERWLTVVNHTTDPLDVGTRAEGQQLLTENALYLRSARARGDLPDAAVLDHLDRVLTTSNHPAEGGLQLRLDMNTDGLLFQIRILRENQTATNGGPQ